MSTRSSASRSPSVFFLLVFALCIPIWLLGAATGIQLLPGLPVSSLIDVSPVTAALILIYRENKSAGVTELLKRSFDFERIKARVWYAPVVLLMPGVTVLSYGFMRLTGSSVPTPQFPVMAPLVMFIGFFIAGLAEELGWMGYAIDPMQDRRNALQAGILLGLVWAAWHIVPVVQAGRSLEYIVWQCLFWVATRVLFVWLYNNTGKSVFAMAVYHATLNVTWQLFPINGSYYDPRITGLIVAFVAVIVTFLWRPESLAQYRYARSS